MQFAPVMHPFNASAVEPSPLADTKNVSRVSPVVSVRVSGKRAAGDPWDDVRIEGQPDAIELQFQWVEFEQVPGHALPP